MATRADRTLQCMVILLLSSPSTPVAAEEQIAVESTLQQLAIVLVLTARQDERLIAIEQRVDRLETAK